MPVCQVMGVVNLTPDSFSDGGAFLSFQAALEHALDLAQAGADWLDLGAESTRPGAEPVEENQEIDRLLPLVEALVRATPVPISVDTMKPAVARAAIKSGARMWNDVSALGFDPQGPTTAAALGCDLVLMHMRGEPRSMQDNPRYDDVVGEVEAFLLARAAMAQAAGVARSRIWLDPGIGFGKTTEHNLALVRALPRLASHGYRLAFGASRKRFIAALDPAKPDPGQRLGGSIALALAAARGGAGMVRVHDVRETVQALRVEAALADGNNQAGRKG
ncbi:MAG: folP [Caulobacteraceae bacterium]|nr:folP [Caulobacteraceae bacterium]